MRLLTKAFLTLASGLLLIAVPGRADTIIINDLTETLSFTHLGSSDTVSGSCTLESCTIFMTPNNPSEATGPSFSLSLAIGEPGGVDISDKLDSGANFLLTSYAISFFSDPAAQIVGTCADFGGCSIIEDGSVQLAGTVGWVNGVTGATRTDTIEFAADVDVPEPSSLILLATGLLGIVGAYAASGSRSPDAAHPRASAPKVDFRLHIFAWYLNSTRTIYSCSDRACRIFPVSWKIFHQSNSSAGVFSR